MRSLPLDDPGVADHRTPGRFLWWLAMGQRRTLLGGMAFGIVWMSCQAVMPAVLGRAIDRGVAAKDARELVMWAGVMFAIGVVQAVSGIVRHRFAVTNWLLAAFRSAIVTERAVRRAGPALTRDKPAGEVLTTFARDFWRMGESFDVTARVAGAIVSFVVVSVILLRGSLVLGLVMLLGGPLLLASLSLVMKPLQKRQQAQREESGRLTALGADTVGEGIECEEQEICLRSLGCVLGQGYHFGRPMPPAEFEVLLAVPDRPLVR